MIITINFEKNFDNKTSNIFITTITENISKIALYGRY